MSIWSAVRAYMPTCPDALAQFGIWRSGSRAKTVCALANPLVLTKWPTLLLKHTLRQRHRVHHTSLRRKHKFHILRPPSDTLRRHTICGSEIGSSLRCCDQAICLLLLIGVYALRAGTLSESPLWRRSNPYYPPTPSSPCPKSTSSTK